MFEVIDVDHSSFLSILYISVFFDALIMDRTLFGSRENGNHNIVTIFNDGLKVYDAHGKSIIDLFINYILKI